VEDENLSVTEQIDCLIVGGGPGGLAAATYLARFRRRAVVIDAAGGRAEWIPMSHNIPGFPDGVSGTDYLALLRAQARRYGADLRQGRVDRLVQEGELFHAFGDGFELAASTVIIATGVVDKTPDLPDLEQAIARGLIRLCPICDGYEATDKTVGVLGSEERAVSEARFLTSYTKRLTLLGTLERGLSDEAAKAAREAGLQVTGPITRLDAHERTMVATLADGDTLIFDAVYAAMGNTPQIALATALGAECNKAGCIQTDNHQRTNVPGLYAIGDVVDELNQVSVATGHAAIAATDVHNQLKTDVRVAQGTPASA
jgi:thioredoxin reductase (NADPH)